MRIYIILIVLSNFSAMASGITEVSSQSNGERFEVSVFRDHDRKREVTFSDVINFKNDNGRQWIEFRVKNIENNRQTIIVHTDIVYLEHFQYHIIRSDSSEYSSPILGWATPIAERPVYDRYFSFPVDISPHETLTILISLKGSGGILFTPVYLYAPNKFYLEQQKFDIIFYGTSIVNIVFIINVLGLFIYFKRKLYGYLLVYGTGYLIYSLNLEGFLASFAPKVLGNIHGLFIGSTTASFFSVLFFITVLQETRRNEEDLYLRVFEKRIIIMYFVTILLSLVFTYNFLQTQIAQILSYGSSIVNIILVAWAISIKNKTGGLLTFIILPVQIVKILVNLNISGLIHLPYISNFNLYHAKYVLLIYEFYLLGVVGAILLFQNFKKASENLSFAQLRFIHATETERQRLAKDLHDDLGGTLSTIKGQAANENASRETLSLIEKAIEDLRNVSRNLMPPELEKTGLAGSVHQAVERLRNVSKTEFVFITFGREVRLAADMELNIYRIIGELLNNILKHAGATKGVVQLLYYDDHLLLSVEDNGTGIKTEGETRGIGLKNIRSRTEYLKATLSVDTGVGGTTMMIKVHY